MHQIQITRTVKRTYQNGKYLVKIKPDRFMEMANVPDYPVEVRPIPVY